MRAICAGLALLMVGCAPTIELDPGEDNPTPPAALAEFDPGAGVIPFPNNLILDPATGQVALPAQCGAQGGMETAAGAASRAAINQLDGFGTYKPALRATFTEPVDPATLTGHAFLFRIADGGLPITTPEVAILLYPVVGTTARFDAACANPALVNAVTFIPTQPLRGHSTYAVALLAGIAAADATPFSPTSTWALVREAEAPVIFDADGIGVLVNRTPLDPTNAADLATLQGLSLLWDVHAGVLTAVLGNLAVATGAAVPREDILLAWSFNTETVLDPLDPAVAGSPAASLGATADSLTITGTVTGAAVPTMIEAVLGAGACTAIPTCNDVGTILTGTFSAPSFQPLAAGPDSNGVNVPRAWNDPLTPTQASVETIELYAFVPLDTLSVAFSTPAARPVVIFGHGLGRSKYDLYAIGSQLAAQGFVAVSIDWVASGSRAVQVVSTGACAGTPQPTAQPECFYPILTADLAGTRDNIRQSVLDLQKLVRVVKGCAAPDSCLANLGLDVDRIGYMGQSLGSLIGGVVVASDPTLAVGVLNVGGVGWVDVLAETDNLSIRCPLIDALIVGDVFSNPAWDETRLSSGADPLCAGSEWKADPGFLAFANVARWMLDPADGANFMANLRAGHSVLIQEVVGDGVVPNVVTAAEGALLGLTPGAAATDSGAAPPVAPTPAAAIAASAHILYTDLAAAGAFPGNFYSHGSLLAPSSDAGEAGPGGQLGTRQMQTDAIAFLMTNLAP